MNKEKMKDLIIKSKPSINYRKEAMKILHNEGILSKDTGVESIESEQDFINFFTEKIPFESKTYEKFRKIVGRKYKENNKDEFVLVVLTSDKSDNPQFYFEKRSKVEFNHRYIQHIVSCIPMIGDDTFILQKANVGDMAGHTTMISGHISYSHKSFTGGLEKLMEDNLYKELYEETGIIGDRDFECKTSIHIISDND